MKNLLLILFTVTSLVSCLPKDGTSNKKKYDQFIGEDGDPVLGIDIEPVGPPYTASFAQNILEITEGTHGYINIRLDRPAAFSMSVSLNRMYFSTATRNLDYIIPVEMIIFSTGEQQKQVFIQSLSDMEQENSESLFLQLQQVSQNLEVNTGYFTVLIKDPEAAPTPPPSPSPTPVMPSLQFSSAMVSANENDVSANLNLTLSSASNNAIQFQLNASSMDATNGSDYNYTNSTTHTINAGQTSISIPIAIIDDNDFEGSESIQFMIQNINGATAGNLTTASLTIVDNDPAPAPPPPTPTPTPDSVTAFTNTLYNNILRNSGTGRCLNCHRPNGTLISINPHHSHDDPAQAHNVIMNQGLVNLNNPAASRLVTKVAGGHNSWSGNAAADAQLIQLQIEAWANALAPTPAPTPPPPPPPAPMPSIQFSNNMISVGEGDGSANLMVTLSAAFTSAIQFSLNINEMGAVSGSDYFYNDVTHTIAAGQTSLNIPVALLDDNINENTESLQFTIQNISSATAGNIISLTLTITDNDAPPVQPTPTPPPANDSVTAFTNTLFNNILRNAGSGRCLNCHRPNGSLISISPYHSHDDPTQAHTTIMNLGLVNLNNPSASRLVTKVAGGHNAWSGNASADAMAVQQQIEAWANALQTNPPPTPTPTPTPSDLKTNQLTMADGNSVSGNRYDANAIALWDFREGNGNIIRDKSNRSPALDLTIAGNIEWIGAQGIKCNAPANGNHWARNNNPDKLYDEITSTNEFTIEVWAMADNAEQEGPSRIISYSNGTGARNFTMGQEGPYLNFRLRSKDNSNNGTNPAYEPQEVVFGDRPAVQHMVMTFNGRERKIYVNSREVKEENKRDGLYDGQFKPLINNIGQDPNWSRNFDLVFCNETSGNRVWKGSIYFAAIHKRALTESQITQNFDAGYTEKTVLSFDISPYTNAGARAETVIEAIDGRTYVFSDLTFKGLNNAVDVKGINILVNDTKAISGQSWAIVERMVQNNQNLMLSAPVIAADQGPAMDRFSLSFDTLGNQSNVIAAPVTFPYENSSIPFRAGEQANNIGTKDFMELNQTFSNLTGVPMTNLQIEMAYEQLKEGLPIADNIDAFSSTNKVNITKLTYQYCSEMVADTNLRNAFFGTSISTSGTAQARFNTTTRNAVSNAIAAKIQTDIASNPTQAEVNTEVQGLITEMIGQGKTIRDILVGSCMLATSSSSTLLK